VPSVHGGALPPAAAKVVVSDSRKVLMLFDGDRLIAQYPASTGSENDPLPIGDWKVDGVHPNPTYHYNPKLFWDAEPGDKKAKVAAGPEQSGRRGLDRPVQAALRHPRHAGAEDDRQDRIARLHSPDQLERRGSGGVVAAGTAVVLQQ
jgi:hypothetical protein